MTCAGSRSSCGKTRAQTAAEPGLLGTEETQLRNVVHARENHRARLRIPEILLIERAERRVVTGFVPTPHAARRWPGPADGDPRHHRCSCCSLRKTLARRPKNPLAAKRSARRPGDRRSRYRRASSRRRDGARRRACESRTRRRRSRSRGPTSRAATYARRATRTTRADSGSHQQRRDRDRRPLHAVTEVVLVMRVPGFEAAEPGRDDGSDRHLLLEPALTHVLSPADALVRPDTCVAQWPRCAARGSSTPASRSFRRNRDASNPK